MSSIRLARTVRKDAGVCVVTVNDDLLPAQNPQTRRPARLTANEFTA